MAHRPVELVATTIVVFVVVVTAAADGAAVVEQKQKRFVLTRLQYYHFKLYLSFFFC
jgi:hypothetical protein